MKKILLTAMAAIVAGSAVLATAPAANAQYYDGPYRYERRGPPPPPYRDPPRRHRHHDNGAAIAGGVAAGLIGGLIGGALMSNNGPRYVEPPPPPPPRCWFEDRRVPNSYDGGWHIESFRVCQ